MQVGASPKCLLCPPVCPLGGGVPGWVFRGRFPGTLGWELRWGSSSGELDGFLEEVALLWARREVSGTVGLA